LATRNTRAEEFLPPSPEFPEASGRFRAAASADHPGYTDLGLWNVLGNPSLPEPQTVIEDTLCSSADVNATDCTAAALLPQSIARFKTPGLRDLGQSGPYMHDGAFEAIEDVLDHYLDFSARARQGQVRNASAQLRGVSLQSSDLAPLAAFLRALNEDYD
jgi:cytochrome c peroxidase